MTLDRRGLLAGAGAAALIGPSRAVASQTRRVFDIYRGRSRIGEQSIAVRRSGNQVEVDIDIDITVRILGLPAYSYRLKSREVWQGGRLAALSARANDNGTRHRVTAQGTGSGIRVEGSAFTGTLRGNPATTTYWTQQFLSRPVWISTQDGTPLDVNVSRAGQETIRTDSGDVSATKYACRGDIGRLDLYYDDAGEWVGSEFDARGETARFVLRDRGGEMASLWVRA